MMADAARTSCLSRSLSWAGSEFLEENDVPVLGLCEGSWLQVSGARATLGGTADARILARGHTPRDIRPGDDLTALLSTRPRYDSPAR
jgi:dipeptidase E